MVDFDLEMKEMEEYAKRYDIPIIEKDSILYLQKFIVEHSINNILEIGTAIGYSAIMMAFSNKNVSVTTIERDDERREFATRMVEKLGLSSRIHIIGSDAFDVEPDDVFDMIFIDASKAQNKKFFLKFCNHLTKNGFIITDNMNFHGFVSKSPDDIATKGLRGIVRKIQDYREFLLHNTEFETQFLDIGDGLSISMRKCEDE